MADTKVQLQRQAVRAQRHAIKAQKRAASAAAGVSSATQSAAQSIQSAAQGVQSATQGVQRTAAGMTAGLRSGTLDARDWAAPRLESAADYTTSTMAPAVSKVVVKTVAPRVSDALRTTARQVRTDRNRSPIRPALAWGALAATVLAGAGAIGTLLWRRHRAATADDSRPDATSYPGGDTEAMTAEGSPSADGVTPPAPDPASTAW